MTTDTRDPAVTGAYADCDAFTRSYLETLLWSSTDSDGNPLDDEYSISDLSPDVIREAARDCAKFQAENADDIEAWPEASASRSAIRAGHDFALTRNRHGAGFWDGDWPDDAGERLTAAAHKFGEISLYDGDDGVIYAG